MLVTSVGVFTFVLSEDTERLFAWTINPPLTAAFLGANYWAAFFLAFLSVRERVWAYARLTAAVSVVFITLTGLATLLHLDKFNFDNANGWLWAIVYFTVPPILAVLVARQLRLPAGDPPAAAPIERWVLPVVAVQLVVALVIGLILFLIPSWAESVWPWTLTPLTARTVGAWLLALAAGLAATLYERDWRRVRVATPTFTAIPLLQAVALVRYSDTPDWDSPRAWLYVSYLACLLALGAYGLRRSWFGRPAPAGEPALSR